MMTTNSAEPRRFGYMLHNTDGSVDIAIIPEVVSDDVVAELEELTSIIFDLQPMLIALNGAERNYLELNEFVAGYQSNLSTVAPDGNIPISLAIEGLSIVTQRLSNFLASATAFLGQTQCLCSQRYPTSSSIPGAWNAKRNALHAESFAFRFLYELRNYSQHYSLPVASFELSGQRAGSEAQLAYTTVATVRRDELLTESYNWKAGLRREIEGQPAHFDLMPFISDYLHILRTLALELYSLDEARFEQCGTYLGAVVRTVPVPRGAKRVMFVGEPTGDGLPPRRFEVIPIDQFGWLARERRRLAALVV